MAMTTGMIITVDMATMGIVVGVCGLSYYIFWPMARWHFSITL